MVEDLEVATEEVPAEADVTKRSGPQCLGEESQRGDRERKWSKAMTEARKQVYNPRICSAKRCDWMLAHPPHEEMCTLGEEKKKSCGFGRAASWKEMSAYYIYLVFCLFAFICERKLSY